MKPLNKPSKTNDGDDEEFSEEIRIAPRRRNNNYIIVNDITEESCWDFREDFFRLEYSDQEIIPIIVDSYGGDVYALNCMLSLIASSNKKVATICDGKAFSCGAVLLSAGSPGLRFISPHAYVLVHQVSHQYYGKYTDISVSTEHCAELNSRLLQMIDKNTGNKKGTFEKILIKNNNADYYIDCELAKSLGIVDHINVPRLRMNVEKNETTLLVNFVQDKK